MDLPCRGVVVRLLGIDHHRWCSLIQRDVSSVEEWLKDADPDLAPKSPGFDRLIRNPHFTFKRLHLDDTAVRWMESGPRLFHVYPGIGERIDPNRTVFLGKSSVLAGHLHGSAVPKRGHGVAIDIGCRTGQLRFGGNRGNGDAIEIDRSLERRCWSRSIKSPNDGDEHHRDQDAHTDQEDRPAPGDTTSSSLSANIKCRD